MLYGLMERIIGNEGVAACAFGPSKAPRSSQEEGYG
jgi:hypothetical protein